MCVERMEGVFLHSSVSYTSMPTHTHTHAQASTKEESEKLHGTFMNMTHQLLTGELEISLYEDQVRALLGTGSYELFTIDKLIHKIINQMRLMVQVRGGKGGVGGGCVWSGFLFERGGGGKEGWWKGRVRGRWLPRSASLL
jgi:hypothetical protein